MTTNPDRDSFQALTQAATSRLESLLRASRAPSPQALAGFEWRGWNTGWQAKQLGIQKFIKGFFQAEGRLEGYNIPVAQNGLSEPWLHQPTAETPTRYAFFCVNPVDVTSRDNRYPAALLLDYGASTRDAASPRIAKRIRDYLVQPDPANDSLLLGKAYLAFGPLRIPSNYFILERLQETAWRP